MVTKTLTKKNKKNNNKLWETIEQSGGGDDGGGEEEANIIIGDGSSQKARKSIDKQQQQQLQQVDIKNIAPPIPSSIYNDQQIMLQRRSSFNSNSSRSLSFHHIWSTGAESLTLKTIAASDAAATADQESVSTTTATSRRNNTTVASAAATTTKTKAEIAATKIHSLIPSIYNNEDDNANEEEEDFSDLLEKVKIAKTVLNHWKGMVTKKKSFESSGDDKESIMDKRMIKDTLLDEVQSNLPSIDNAQTEDDEARTKKSNNDSLGLPSHFSSMMAQLKSLSSSIDGDGTFKHSTEEDGHSLQSNLTNDTQSSSGCEHVNEISNDDILDTTGSIDDDYTENDNGTYDSDTEHRLSVINE